MRYGWEKSLIIFPIIGLGLIYNAYKSGDGVYEVCVCNFAPTVNAIMRVNILPSLRVTPPCDQFEDKRV